MKHMKQYLALLMALAMLFALAACGGSPAEPEQTEAPAPAADAPQQEAPPEPEEPAEPENPQPESNGGNEFNLVKVDLPLTEENVELSFFFSQPPFFSAFIDSPSDNPCFQELEARTNVTLDFQLASSDAEAEQFRIAAASGTLPDLVMSGSSLYTGGGAKAVDDEIFVNLVDYEDAMPNYFAYVRHDPSWTSLLSTSNGTVVDGVYVLAWPTGGNGTGILIREDWLEELNLDMPQTYDEYHEVLTAFKTEKGCSAPLLIHGECSNNVWAVGFGTACAISDHDMANDCFGVIDGKVVFWPLMDGFREYLETMGQWYAEGLIDQDWTTRIGNEAEISLIANNQSGAWFSTLGNITMYDNDIDDPNARVVPAPIAGKDKDYTDALITAPRIRDRTTVNISTNCTEPEIAARFLDYTYSEEGQLLCNYGVEGVTFEYDANGKPQFTEFITNSDTGFDASLAMVLYGLNNYPSVFDNARFYGDRQLDAIDIWTYNTDNSKNQSLSSAVEVGTEDLDEISCYSDILTKVRETTFNIMCSKADMSAYDDMVQVVTEIGIDRVIAAYQRAYDAFSGK